MKWELIVCQWILMFIGWSAWGETIGFAAFGAALALGLWGVAGMIRRVLWPELVEEDLDKVYERGAHGMWKPDRQVFEHIAKHWKWSQERFERWAREKEWR